MAGSRVSRVSLSRPALRLLGPLEVCVQGRRVELAANRLRSLLTALVVAGPSGASVDRLTHALWGDDEPANPRRSLQTYVVRLRHILGKDAIVNTSGGYALRVGDDDLDVRVFDRALDQAEALAGRPGERAVLDRALELWRGTPFDGVDTSWLVQAERGRLTERYVGALERRVRLDLDAGRHAELLPELRELTARHPLRESLWALLLTALERSGRRAEALDQYERIRARIADELGADPGPQLRAVHAALLVEAPAAAGARAGAAPLPVPHQLPPATPGFVGRTDVIADLDRRLVPGSDPPACVVITGTAGVGKTAVAVQWARRAADRFPDGQLYLDLRGFAPGGRPVEPADAVRALLEALQVPAARIPATTDAQLGLYRSALAGRRMMVVLDNARDAAQVRPLLPGSAGSVALVTSRRRLTGLSATAGAHLIALDLPSADEARRLLSARLGGAVAAAGEHTVNELIALCARLPLALTVVAARIATAAGSISTTAEDLRRARRLDALTDDDDAVDLRSVFSWSYAGLDPAAARLFRYAGAAPGPELDVPAAAALADLGPPEAAALFARLARAHLVEERDSGRYGMHDLLREYATELAGADDPAGWAAAEVRLVEHRAYVAVAAVRLLRPGHQTPGLGPAGPAAAVREFTTEAEALTWFDLERDALLATVEAAAATGPAGPCWELAAAVMVLIDRQGRWAEAERLARTCLVLAARLGSDGLAASAHRWLGRALGRLGRPDEALAELRAALNLWTRTGDRSSRARALRSIAIILEDVGRFEEVLTHNLEALELFRAVGDRPGEADALNAVGWAYVLLGEHEMALARCREALDLVTALDDTFYLAVTWDSMGGAHRGLRDWPAAVEAYERAAGLFSAAGAFYDQANSLASLAECLDDAGDGVAAAEARTRAAAARAMLDRE